MKNQNFDVSIIHEEVTNNKYVPLYFASNLKKCTFVAVYTMLLQILFLWVKIFMIAY